MKFVMVYKTGGDFIRDDVDRLWHAIAEQFPSARINVYTDDEDFLRSTPRVAVPLRHNLPGWWSKMEIFEERDGIRGSQAFLYLDLDSMIVGSLGPLVQAWEMRVMMRDVNRPDGFQSSIMYLPANSAGPIWDQFQREGPQRVMDRYAVIRQGRAFGDQAFLETCGPWLAWQDVAPGRVCSYKADVWVLGYVPRACSVVAFHGRPRPREIGFKLPPTETRG